MIYIEDVLGDVPDIEVLQMVDMLLFSVYGWKPEKIRRMRLESMKRWIKYAKKKMTFKDAYLLKKMLEPKAKKKWWQKILKTKN